MFRALTTVQKVVDVSIAIVFALVCVGGTLDAVPLSGAVGVAVDVVVVLVLAVALALRRASPAWALIVAWAAAIVQMGFGRPPAFADVAIFAVLYATAAYGSRPVFWTGFASAIGGAAATGVYLYAAGLVTGDGGWRAVTVAVLVAVAALFALLLSWTAGALVRTARRARENRRAQMRAEADAAAEAERVRIARDMHDVVAHSLAVVIAQADGARYAATADPDAATAALGTISTTARAALADVRLLLTQLRHSQSDGPQPTIADLEGLYARVRAAGVDLRVSVAPAPPGEPPAAVQLAVFRILQEALTNALRHGDGGQVAVALAWQADRVELAVTNGVGESGGPGAGHGLIGMRERAQLVGGHLDAGADGSTFIVRATLPIGGAP